MIIEIRKYRLYPGRRADFITFFEDVNRAALRDAGMKVFGPMLDVDDPDVVHWMRAFETLETRDSIKGAFYGGDIWAQDVEPIVMPMIADMSASIVETTAGFEGFDGNNTLF